MSTNAAKRWRWLLISSLLASLQLTPLPLLAQTPATRFEHLSVEDGLSHSAVFAIEQDRHGFLWLGTRKGLNRYDGYRFRVFQPDPEDPDSLSGSSVYALLEDRQGELWIGTWSGLDRFHRTEERFLHHGHDPEDPRSLSNDLVMAIFEDRTGSLWVATFGGLNRRAPDGTFVRYLHDPADEGSLSDPRVQALAEDREGRLWVGTHRGLDLFDRRSATFRHFRHVPADPSSLGDDLVNAIREDAGGGLWVGTARGLNRFDPETETFTRYRHGPVDLTAERIFKLFHRDVVGDLFYLVQEVGRKEHRAPFVGDGAHDGREDVTANDGIEAGRRLVEHQQLGTIRQRDEQPRPRLLPLRRFGATTPQCMLDQRRLARSADEAVDHPLCHGQAHRRQRVSSDTWMTGSRGSEDDAVLENGGMREAPSIVYPDLSSPSRPPSEA